MLMKNKWKYGFLFIAFVCVCSVRSVHANSSWIWLTKTEPYEILPIAAGLTIFIEVTMIALMLHIRNVPKIFFVIITANLVSFFVPYILSYFSMKEMYGAIGIADAFASGPYYIVGLGYFIFTIVLEFPIVYKGLKKEIENKRRSIWVICMANVITTIMVGFIERILCYGQW